MERCTVIYLDNAATSSPKPQSVTETMLRGMRISANPGRGGHEAAMRASQEVFSARKALSGFFNLNKPQNVIFTQNCTHGLNTAIFGLIKNNSHVVCSDLEHNRVLRVLEKMKNEGKIRYSIAKTYPDDNDTVRSFENEIRRDTRAIICTHASNVFADVLPIERIGALCRKYNLIFIVDAAQSAGVIPIDVEKMNITALCLSGHKGLYGSMGTGALLLRTDDIKPLIFGGTGSESQSPEQPLYLPDRLESGTLNLPGIMSVKAGVDFVRRNTPECIHRCEAWLCSELYDFLKNDGRYEVFSRIPCEKSVPIVSFRHREMHSEETAEILGRYGFCVRAGYHCAYLAHKSRGTADSGLVRVSTGVFNSKNDLKKLINCLNKIENI